MTGSKRVKLLCNSLFPALILSHTRCLRVGSGSNPSYIGSKCMKILCSSLYPGSNSTKYTLLKSRIRIKSVLYRIQACEASLQLTLSRFKSAKYTLLKSRIRIKLVLYGIQAYEASFVQVQVSQIHSAEDSPYIVSKHRKLLFNSLFPALIPPNTAAEDSDPDQTRLISDPSVSTFFVVQFVQVQVQ